MSCCVDSNRYFSIVKLKGSAKSAEIAVCFDLDTFFRLLAKEYFLGYF